jgi:pilus assembly protein CpaB
MGSTRIAILIVAAVCSVGLAFLVLNMMGSKKPPPVVVASAPIEQPMTRVLVAKRDLKVGERLDPSVLSWLAWPAKAVNPAFITDGAARNGAAGVVQAIEAASTNTPALQSVSGAIVREPLLANEPVIQRKLVRGGEGGFMSVMLDPGMRAFGVPVTVESAAGGFILPGDHVDVLLNEKITVKGPKEDTSSMAVAKVLMRNLRVLAIDQQTEPAKGAAAMVGAVATLAVPEQDVAMLAAAKGQGELILSLRSYTDSSGPSGRAVSAAHGTDLVRVIRSGDASEVRVAQ